MKDSIQTKVEAQQISLSFNTWVKLISLTVAAVASFFGMFAQSQHTMYELDLKWQERIASLAEDLKTDIHRVERQLPPDWFKKQVEENRKHIDDLEDEVTRDFVRKEELKAILDRMK